MLQRLLSTSNIHVSKNMTKKCCHMINE